MVRWQTWQAQRFKIFESARHCRIASGRLIRIQIEASQVPILHFLLPDASSSTCPCLCVLLAGLLQFTAGWSCRHKMLQLALCPELAVAVTSHQSLHVCTGCLFIEGLSSRRQYSYKSRHGVVPVYLLDLCMYHIASDCRHVVNATSLDDDTTGQNSFAVRSRCHLQLSTSSSVDIGHFTGGL